jgi:AcrR family transcriptional regulator
VAKRPLPRHEQQERTRARLLDAAAKVFARRGYHAAKLEEVAREAGYSTGAVYSNFDGKEDLFLALADRHIAERIEQIGSIAEAATDADALRTEVGRRFGAILEQSPDWPLLYYEFWSYAVRNPRLRPEFEARDRAVREAIAKAVERGAARQGRRLVHPAESIAAVIRGVTNGLSFERAVDAATLPDEVVGFAIWTLLQAASEPED